VHPKKHKMTCSVSLFSRRIDFLHSEACLGRLLYACWYGPRRESSEPDVLSSAATAGAGRRVSAEGRAATTDFWREGLEQKEDNGDPRLCIII
jgi:hypothetical protein